ncbi:hypothetical protein RQP46_007840 [Phenoliferia psychrophenolica]
MLFENLPALPPRRAQKQSKNPFVILGSLSTIQWLLFLSGMMAWISDAIDFFAVSLSITRLVVEFEESTSAITQSITLTLLLRPAGALGGFFGFGIAMGGIWGQAASTSLENMPLEACGLFSGFLTEGYAVVRCVYAVCLMTGLNFYSHGTRFSSQT